METPLFVSVEWLYQHIDDAKIRIIDIRGHVSSAQLPPPHYFAHHEAYKESHLPHAVFVDWTEDIVEPGSHSYDALNPDDFEKLASSLGIDKDTHVIVYDDAQSMFAARMWWILKYYGHEKVSVLNGGWNKWLEMGYPITDLVPQIEAKPFQVKIDPQFHVNADYILSKLEDKQTAIMDVRSVGEFAGEASRAKRFGHIPGAINLPRSELVSEVEQLPSHNILADQFQKIGLDDPNQEIIVYCNGGVSASYGMMALIEAGYKQVRLYDGSWKDWGNDSEKPIE